MAYDGPFTINNRVAAFLDLEPALFIDGKRVSSDQETTLPIYDPSSGKVIAVTPDATASDIDRAVRSGDTAFRDGRWRNMRPTERERILLRFADLVIEHGEVLAQLETLEQGKSINLSRGFEVSGSVDWMRYAAGLATKLSGRTFDSSLPGGPQRWTTYTRREPIGVVAGIAPWNFPMMIALWKVMPALAAGCSIVLKPSEITPLTAMMLAEIAIEAGVPSGVFNVVTGRGSRAGAALVHHPLITKISFTGSTATGLSIGRAAIANMARFTLELGGKNPAIVLKDADLDIVVPGLIAGGLLNGGQVCAAASRIYVEAALYDDLVQALESAISAMKVGAGLDPEAEINPLVSLAHQAKVQAYIDDARSRGADILCGGIVPAEGYFVPPALVLEPADDVKLKREEVFGPVLGISQVTDAAQAISLANDTTLGLAASLWTRDLGVAMNLTPQIKAGTIWVNTHLFIDPNMPFGGFKQSGMGRDFGVDWLDAYTELKAICISH